MCKFDVYINIYYIIYVHIKQLVTGTHKFLKKKTSIIHTSWDCSSRQSGCNAKMLSRDINGVIMGYMLDPHSPTCPSVNRAIWWNNKMVVIVDRMKSNTCRVSIIHIMKHFIPDWILKIDAFFDIFIYWCNRYQRRNQTTEKKLWDLLIQHIWKDHDNGNQKPYIIVNKYFENSINK